MRTEAADGTAAAGRTTVARRTEVEAPGAGGAGGAAVVAASDHHRLRRSRHFAEDATHSYHVATNVHHGHVVAPARLGECLRGQVSEKTSWGKKS